MNYSVNMLVERVHRRLSGGDVPNDSPYDPAFLRADIVDAINEEVKAELIKRKMGGEDDKTPLAQVICHYVVDTVKDSVTDRIYATLPSSFLSLKHNKGIHSVSPVKKSLKVMIPITNPAVTANLPHADLERETYGYYVEGMKVWFMRDIKQDKIHQVLIKLLIGAPTTLTDDDILPLLPESVAVIIDRVWQRNVNMKPQDRLNDGNPNLRALNEQPKQ